MPNWGTGSSSRVAGEEALSETDRLHLRFAEDFEKVFLSQGDRNRSIEETLDLAWRLLSAFPEAELPDLRQQVDYIELALEERAREDLFRLKKVKKALTRRSRQRAHGG